MTAAKCVLLLTHLPRYLTHQISIHIGPRYQRVSIYLRNARRLCLGFGKEGKRSLRTRPKTTPTTRRTTMLMTSVLLIPIAKPETLRRKTKFTSKKTSNSRMRSLSRGSMTLTVIPPSLTPNPGPSPPIPVPIRGNPTMIPGITHYFSLAYARHSLPSYATFVIVRLFHPCASAIANDPHQQPGILPNNIPHSTGRIGSRIAAVGLLESTGPKRTARCYLLASNHVQTRPSVTGIVVSIRRRKIRAPHGAR